MPPRVFVVFGPAGTGKSFLLNYLFGTDFVANDSSSHVTVAQETCTLKNGDIVMDTVGFDDKATNFPNLAAYDNHVMVAIYLNNSMRVDVPLKKLADTLRIAASKINVYNFFCGDGLPAKSDLPSVIVHKYQSAKAHFDGDKFKSFTYTSPLAGHIALPSTSTAKSGGTESRQNVTLSPWQAVFPFVVAQKEVNSPPERLLQVACDALDHARVKQFRSFGEAVLRLLAEHRVLHELAWDLSRVQTSLTNPRMTNYLNTFLGKDKMRLILQKVYPSQANTSVVFNEETTADVFEAAIGIMFAASKRRGRALLLAWRFLDWHATSLTTSLK